MIDIDKLEALAKAATPGPYQWTTYGDHDGPPACDVIMAQALMNDCWEELCTFAWYEKTKYHPVDRAQAEANAAYAVASNPAAILTLIAEVRAVRAVREDAERYRWLRDEAIQDCRERPFGIAVGILEGEHNSAGKFNIKAWGVTYDVDADGIIDSARQEKA